MKANNPRVLAIVALCGAIFGEKAARILSELLGMLM